MVNVVAKKTLAHQDSFERKIAALETQQKKYDESYRVWLKGRDIRVIEQEAQGLIEKAKVEAANILSEARDEAFDLRKTQKEIKRKEERLDNEIQINQRLTSELKDATAQMQKAKRKYESALKRAEKEFNDNQEIKSILNTKLEKLQQCIAGLLDDDID